ncbi:hypothetical protein [Polyangium aurulentum]|uniref:hypothetical protein n=1 Tax=Polyangium aurulentum TaxID=2567896 RepID=UPI0010AE9AAD|nr:hypothetical protein [Polyangium aurulentum]UQA61870.1 hypothetical protein E8A73_015910 [Polyangium aurulentum]
MPGRRAFLGAVLASLGGLVSGCGGSERPPSPPRQPSLPKLATSRLDALLPLAGLKWLILARPREIASIPWLIPPIGTIVPEDRFAAFAASTGLDLRQIPEAIVASYAAEEGDVSAYVVRHGGDAVAIERAFRRRLTSSERRSVDRPDVVRVSGKIGTALHAFAAIGPDVVCFQQGGSVSRGPVRVATLYAMGKLKRSPAALAEDPLRSLAGRFGAAPAKAFALGPFEGELARGARGLLAAATAIGAAARPSAREGIALAVAVAGDFSKSGEPAERELLAAWDELARGSFGHLLGLDAPVTAPLATHSDEAVAIAVELDPGRLAKGLADATRNQIAEIMR